MNYKNLLIVSHNCLSQSGSNGRTLLNYLSGWDSEKIAQLYIHMEQPDFSLCKNFYCITDQDVLCSVLKRRPAGRRVGEESPEDKNVGSSNNGQLSAQRKVKKNSVIALIRELAWMSGLWNSKQLEKWIDEFNPQLILFQAGDAAFLFRLVRKIAQKRKIPVVIYNTEGYFFKSISYMDENKFSRLVYPLVHKLFCREYKRLLKLTKQSVYNCDLLREDYDKVFHSSSKVVMNISEFTAEQVETNKKNQIIYAGNLGVGRHKSLIEFAEALHKVAPNMYVDVYGKTPNDCIKSELKGCKGIVLHGFISYNELKHRLKESKYLLHIESFDPFYKVDLKYALSTKIADSLSVGACLFVYAPNNMAVIRYLQSKDAAVLITEPERLSEQILAVINNDDLCSKYASNGRALALEQHHSEKNRIAFQSVLIDGDGF